MILNETLETDHYTSITTEGSAIFKDRGSKFIGYCFKVTSVEEAMERLNELKSEHHDARHHCYAYRINPENAEVRYNDDGEPSNSAGIPIFNQIRSADLWNTMIVVVRYFGGTKLGVPGLINAYRSAAEMAVAASKTSVEYITDQVEIRFPYPQMNEVMRMVKDTGADLLEERMGTDAGYVLGIRRNNLAELIDRIEQNHLVAIK